ncbi:hypothetical protein [Bartonella schoenbuchensis]|uniref:hypothetical protein n=1 Tax=Bartonella schoenbuchensis TaxID=165694 RepID=UPI003144E912
MRFFLSVKRTALLGIFISTFMFTGYAHSEQPVVTYENKPMAELRQPIMTERPPLIHRKNTEVLGHIDDFTPEQLRELFSKNKGNKNVPIVRNNKPMTQQQQSLSDADQELIDTNYYNSPIIGHIDDYRAKQRQNLVADNKTPRKLRIDDFVFPIALLIFISIMSIPISLLWRFGLKVPASLFIITTAVISGSILLMLAFG